MNKTFIGIGISVIIIVMIFALLNFKDSKTNSVNHLLDSTEFITKYKSIPDSELIDVRTPAEFNYSHIASSTNIDYENSDFESRIDKLDKAKTYFIYCRSGNRSSMAIRMMKSAGIDKVYELKGGIISDPELLK